MTYWLDLFTGTTWTEFQKAGATISGFRPKSWKRAQPVKPGDLFLCYMVSVKRWVGVLEVESGPFKDESSIFAEEVFPIRFKVIPRIMLPAENGVPMELLKGKLSFYQNNMTGKQWSGHVRGSLNKYSEADGRAIADALRQAAANPIPRPVDPRQLHRPVNLYRVRVQTDGHEVVRVVSIPDGGEEAEIIRPAPDAPSHSEIQWRLLDLGSQMGLDVWAPKRDRARTWKSSRIGEIPHILDRLPRQFDENTNRTIEEIDVLWLHGQTIVAAFEVEHTTSIFSGLLRMADLLTMQPNITIKLYIVGPDDRHDKFEAEVARPTFAVRPKPLHSLCRFLPYSKLCQRLKEAHNVIRFLRPEFLDEIANLYNPEDHLS